MRMQYYTVSPKNNTDLSHYNFDADQPILIVFGRWQLQSLTYRETV